MGDSLDAVEVLLKKHENFEKSLAAQEEKVKAVDEIASRLILGGHYAGADIDSRRKEVSSVCAKIEACECTYVCGVTDLELNTMV